jgi:hypothetical protein
MKINQLFKEKVPEDLLQDILSAFGLRDIHDDSCFSKAHLEGIDTLEKMKRLRDSLIRYYLPCKAKVYLNAMTLSKCITILRQILKLYQVKMISKQKYINYRKKTIYMIVKNNDVNQHCFKVDASKHHLDFD